MVVAANVKPSPTIRAGRRNSVFNKGFTKVFASLHQPIRRQLKFHADAGVGGVGVRPVGVGAKLDFAGDELVLNRRCPGGRSGPRQRKAKYRQDADEFGALARVFFHN